jgi:flavin-dependent dehydrogenase
MEGYPYKGYPIPLFKNPQHLTKGGMILVGDAGNLVDPFFGEGIYYAMRSGQIASAVVSGAIHKGSSDLSRYDTLLATELYPEFMAAQKISHVVYTFPMMWYDLLSERPELAEEYYNVLRGDSSYTIFLKELKAIAGSLMKTAIKSRLLQLFSKNT